MKTFGVTDYTAFWTENVQVQNPLKNEEKGREMCRSTKV